MKIQQALNQLLDKQDLSTAQMRDVMQLIMNGSATDAQIAGFLIALRCKGESIDEIVAAVTVIRELANKVLVSGEHMIDTCGTGGDGANTFNISTTCAFVVAAAGGQVVKHGNRSVSSNSGSADVLEAAGVYLDLSSAQVAQCVHDIGIGFLFAPRLHSAMKYAIGPRKEMGVRTLFNLIGPLSNPANTTNQLIGVFSAQWLVPLAQTLKNLGSQHVLLVNAEDGLDEISIACPSTITELKNGFINTYQITPEYFGIPQSNLDSLVVTDAKSSLSMLKAVLNNQTGAAKDIVILNAGAAIYAANLTTTIEAGIKKARQLIASGAALEKFNKLVSYTHKIKTHKTTHNPLPKK